MIDYIGKRFGRLVVLQEVQKHYYNNGKFKRKVICLCDCGSKKIYFLNNLGRHAKSCGCYKKEKGMHHGFCIGGKSQNIYLVHNGIKQRCKNKNDKGYKYYGGRGITYDPKRDKFEGFYEDMGASYKKGLTIERIDVNGNYCKENCMRATVLVQNRNRSNSIKYGGKCVSEWALIWNITRYKAKKRLLELY